MGFYPEKIERRLSGLRPNGPMVEATCATAASFECGCYVRVGLDVDPKAGTISRLGIQTNGCGYMVAAGDVLAEKIEDTPLSELHGLRSSDLLDDIRSLLGIFPAGRLQCAEVPIEALRDAFAQYRSKRIAEFAGEQALICTCFGISENTIESAISDPSVVTIDDVGCMTRAGTGCGSCQMLIQEMLDAREGR